MSAVGVPVVLDAVAARIIRGECARVDELLNARAAVAELVEAGFIAQQIMQDAGITCFALDDALARVGGAK